MTFVPNFPPSILRKVGDQDEDGKKKTKEDFKKMKELEEARKLAVMPAMKDEEGRDINPHIPQYIMQAPWYYGALQPTLRHQRIQDEEKRDEASGTAKGSSAMDTWYNRGVVLDAPRAKKYRDGACENCGSMTHIKKECLERPRKIGARFTGLDIAPDEQEQGDLKFTYDAKRDRWNGYDPREHQRFIAEYQRLEEARKLVKAKKMEEKLAAATTKDEGQEPAASAAAPTLDEEEEGDDDRYGDELDMPGQKFDSKQRQSIRNLRIREDTAKYLFNLDPNSAYYDPKTRAMRENPFENSGKPESEVPFAGDNFVRNDGDAPGMMNRQVFAWEMHNKLGLDLHLQADPTRLEMLAKKVSTAKNQVQSTVREEILDRYGGREHFEAPAKDLLMGQWESYAEYTPTGRVLRGLEKPTVKSRYEEDVYIKNHKSVWGSYWYAGQWGYQCCHSLVKESYCTGAKGKDLNSALPEAPTDVADVACISSLLTPSGRLTVPSNTADADNNNAFQATLPALSAGKKRKHKSSTSDIEEVCEQDHCDENLQNKEEEEEEEEEEGIKEEEIDEVELDRREKAREAELARSAARRAKKAEKRRKHKKRSKKNKHHKHKRHASSSSSSSSSGSSSEKEEDEETVKEKRIKALVEKEKKRLAEVDRMLAAGERAHAYNSLKADSGHMPTEEEMEAYYRTRKNYDDPMSHFK